MISRHTRIRSCKGKIKLNCLAKFGIFKIGYDTIQIFDNKKNRAILYNEGEIIINGRGRINQGCKISVFHNGVLSLGQNFDCTASTQFLVKKRIEFGDDCLISWDCLFMDSDFHILMDSGIPINRDSEIIIGNHCWIGARCTILKGTKINDNCIISANSTISGNLDESEVIYTGLPLRILKNNIQWIR